MEKMPWWVSVFMGAGILGIGWIVLVSVPAHHPAQFMRVVWWLVPLFFGATAAGSVIAARRARVSMLKRETLRDLQSVPWQEFEQLTGAYYRERGFTVVHTGEDGPDGGIDLVLRKDGERVLVQCKKHVREAVGVQAVREFFGVMVAEGAHRGIFITTSNFTSPAMEFGLAHASLELIPGQRFAEMIAHLRKGKLTGLAASPVSVADAGPSPAETAPCCPRCATVMVTRVAKQGANAGQSFWGCPQYPACRGTRAAG